MKEVVSSASHRPDGPHHGLVACLPQHGDAEGLTPLAFRLELQSTGALLTVLTTMARLGCRTPYVLAAEQQVTIGVLAPPRVAHRVQKCLNEIIEVLAVSETTISTGEEAGTASATHPV
jgi:hypothetical protein